MFIRTVRELNKPIFFVKEYKFSIEVRVLVELCYACVLLT